MDIIYAKKQVTKLNNKQLINLLDNYYMPRQLLEFIKSLLIKRR